MKNYEAQYLEESLSPKVSAETFAPRELCLKMLSHFAASTKNFSNPQNSYAKTFIYDREDLVMEIQDQKVKAFYVHAPGIDNPIAILRDMNNNEEFDDDEVFIYTKDHLGSIRELVGLDGKLKQRHRYSAYGITTREKNTDEMDRLIDHAYGFTGRELDSETGLYFYRARYYHPSTGVFLSRDSLGFAAGDTNLYRYVFNNPIKFKDPFGMDTEGIGGLFSIGFFGFGGSIDVQKVRDDKGNTNTVVTFCGGGVTEVAGIFLGAIQSSGNADTVADLAGVGGSFGVGVSVPGVPVSPGVGGGVSFGTSQCGKKTTTTFTFEGASAGFSPVDVFGSACKSFVLD